MAPVLLVRHRAARPARRLAGLVGVRRPGRAAGRHGAACRCSSSPPRRTASCSGIAALARQPRRRGVGAAAPDGRRPAARATLRDQLADALGDPSLEVVYWLDERARWVDADGHAVELPGEDDPAARGHRGRAATAARRRHRARPRAVRRPRAARLRRGRRAGLALENERLQAAAARPRRGAARRRARGWWRPARPSAAGSSATCTTAPSSGSSRCRSPCASPRAACARTPTPRSALLGGAQEELGLALEELRELARGIHPAVLSDRGLGAALEGLAGRSPVPVELEPRPAGAAARARRGGRVLRRRRGADQRGQVRRRLPGARCASRATTATRSWRSPTTASAGADPRRGSGLRGPRRPRLGARRAARSRVTAWRRYRPAC